MKEITILDDYNLIIIRFNEIWLKSTKIKIRMLKAMMRNIKNMLNRSGIPFNKYQLSKDSSRVFYFFKNEEIIRAIDLFKRVFGIHTFSPAIRTSNKLNNIISRVVDVGEKILQKNDTFALRVRRSGKHDFSSRDVAVKGGQAILDEFQDLNLKVNLSSPKKRIFVEVRGEFSYLFTDIIKSNWGGMPIESNKKIMVMDVGRLNDLLAGFLIARRGGQIFPVLFDLSSNSLESRCFNWSIITDYLPNFKFIVRKIDLRKIMESVLENLKEKKYACSICRLVRFDISSRMLKNLNIENFDRIRAITDGVSFNNDSSCPDEVDLESISLSHLFSEYPIFTPTIGLSAKKTEEFLTKISANLKRIDYCKFKPKKQEINAEILKSLYDSLNLNDLIDDCLENIEEINIL